MRSASCTPPRRPLPRRFALPTAVAASATGHTPPTGCLLPVAPAQRDAESPSMAGADGHLLRTVLWSAWLHDVRARGDVTQALLALEGREWDERTDYCLRVMLASQSSDSLLAAIVALPATHPGWVWEATVAAATPQVLAAAYRAELHALAAEGRDDATKLEQLMTRLDARQLYKMQWKYARQYVEGKPAVRFSLEQAGVVGGQF